MNAPHKQTRAEAELGRAMVRIGELEEEIARLQRLLVPARGTPPAWRLTAKEERLMLAMELVYPRILTKDAAIEMVWPNNPPQDRVIDVMICHIRKKIAPTGGKIITVWYRGHRLDQATVDAIRDYDIAVDTTE